MQMLDIERVKNFSHKILELSSHEFENEPQQIGIGYFLAALRLCLETTQDVAKKMGVDVVMSIDGERVDQ